MYGGIIVGKSVKTVKIQVKVEGDAAHIYEMLKHKSAGVAVGLKILYDDERLRGLFFDDAQIQALEERLEERPESPSKGGGTTDNVSTPKVGW